MNFSIAARFILILISILTLSNCYEGSSRKRNSPNEGDGGGVNPRAASRPYYFILFEPIFLSQSSMSSPGCFQGLESERIYRVNEWNSRINLIRKGLEEMADIFVFNQIIIAPEQCKKFETIELHAANGLGTGNTIMPTTPDSRNRPSLHLKAVFWDRDNYSVYPSSTVRAVDWKDGLNLKAANIRSKSLHYMVISNRHWGFFEFWRTVLPTSSLLAINGITSPDPGENGIALRDQQVQKETLEFFEWLKGASLDQNSVGL
jgi:hypothetical protein